MIIDTLENAAKYLSLNPRFKKALEILSMGSKLKSLAEGRIPLSDDDSIYANVQTYDTKPVEGAHAEAHRKYIDIQLLADGVEQIGWVPFSDGLKTVTAYDETKDIGFYDSPAGYDFATLRPGIFMILFPQDAHMPGRQLGVASKVKKIVIKVAV